MNMQVAKSKELIRQIKSQTINNGNFKNLAIGDNKLTVINRLRELQAFYITTEDNHQNGYD